MDDVRRFDAVGCEIDADFEDPVSMLFPIRPQGGGSPAS
jgi:hypothetical protein